MISSLKKVIAVVLIVGINYTGLASVGETKAVFTGGQGSDVNLFESGSLDMVLVSQFETSVLLPGESIAGSIEVQNNGSILFEYNASSTVSESDVCGALWLEVGLNGEGIYIGSLASFVSEVYVVQPFESSIWQFILSLPENSPSDLALHMCDFGFIFDAWQSNLYAGVGFHDSESATSSVSFGDWSDKVIDIEPQDILYSPVRDAEVRQGNPTHNYGSSVFLSASSDEGANTRVFIEFDIPFPVGTTIHSAVLNMYMYDTPPLSRTLSIQRAQSSWAEEEIHWNNQPAGSGSDTDVVVTGNIANIWLPFDVTSDVVGFVTGVFDNNGWVIRDQVEDGAVQNVRFRSRNYSALEVRPTLEIAVSLPVADTSYVIINEIYTDVLSGKGSDVNNEWIELYNPTDEAIDVGGFDVCDNTSCDTIPVDTVIPAHGFLVITNNISTAGYWDIPVGVELVPLGSAIGNGLANGGDRLILRDIGDVVVDMVSYGTDTTAFTPSAPAPLEGISLARIIKGYDTNSATDWVLNATPNPGTNPGSDAVEIVRLTPHGWYIAPESDPLPPLETEVLLLEESSVADEVDEGSIKMVSYEGGSAQALFEEDDEVEHIASTTPPVKVESKTVNETSTTTESIEVSTELLIEDIEEILDSEIVNGEVSTTTESVMIEAETEADELSTSKETEESSTDEGEEYHDNPEEAEFVEVVEEDVNDVVESEALDTTTSEEEVAVKEEEVFVGEEIIAP